MAAITGYRLDSLVGLFHVKRNPRPMHHPLEHLTGSTVTGRAPTLVRAPPGKQTASQGTSVPMEDFAVGRGIVLPLSRSRFCDGLGVIRDI